MKVGTQKSESVYPNAGINRLRILNLIQLNYTCLVWQ